MDETRQELHGLKLRFLVAVLLDIFTLYYGQQAGFKLSDPNPRGVALGWASEFHTLERLCFLLVIFKIALVPVVVERLRRAREECDVKLVLGSICLFISLSFSAYLR